MGTLYLVATPIGNAEDISYRAVRVLREVDLIAAEDTRHSGRLLKYLEIDTPLVSYHGDSPESRLQEILRELERGNVAVITDAGVPGVSDPGAALVRAATEQGFPVEIIPGPSAVTSAVALSGLVDSGFVFGGYPPRNKRERREFLVRWSLSGLPLVLFESPHRLVATLEDLAETFAGGEIAVCRELTKMHEEVVRGSIDSALDHFRQETPRGEFVLVVRSPKDGSSTASEADAEEIARRLIDQGMAASAAAKEVARVCELTRSDAYAVVMDVKNRERDAGA